MTSTYEPGDGPQAGTVREPWVLVFGGVTRMGTRRARRAVSEALESGFDVVWFDGSGDEQQETRKPVRLDRGGIGRLHIVAYVDAEAATLASRLRSGRALQSNPLLRALWRHVLRRIGSLLRARACWTTIRPDVKRLARGSAPAAIVCGDDHSITSAWYASRIWPDAPVSTQLVLNIE